MTPAMALTSVASRRYGPCAIAIDMFYPLVHASGGYTFGHVAKSRYSRSTWTLGAIRVPTDSAARTLCASRVSAPNSSQEARYGLSRFAARRGHKPRGTRTVWDRGQVLAFLVCFSLRPVRKRGANLGLELVDRILRSDHDPSDDVQHPERHGHVSHGNRRRYHVGYTFCYFSCSFHLAWTPSCLASWTSI